MTDTSNPNWLAQRLKADLRAAKGFVDLHHDTAEALDQIAVTMANIVADGEDKTWHWDFIVAFAKARLATLSTPEQEDAETEKELRDHIQNKADPSLLQKMRADAKAGGLDAVKKALGEI